MRGCSFFWRTALSAQAVGRSVGMTSVVRISNNPTSQEQQKKNLTYALEKGIFPCRLDQ